MTRTKIHVDVVRVKGASGSGLDPVRLRAEVTSQITSALSARGPSRVGNASVPAVRVESHAKAGSAGVARAVASAVTRSLPTRKGTP